VSESQQPALYFAPTPDRWALALHRYPQPDREAPAALLCSGYGCNRHFIDFDEQYSLARFLAGRGFDTWVVELRGRGRSRPMDGCPRPRDWTFDDLARTDVPSAIAFVQREVAHRRLCWIGHSLGGMVLYAYLGLGGGEPRPAAAVTLGSPVMFPRARSPLWERLGSLALALPIPRSVPQRPVLGALWHVAHWFGGLGIGMNPENVDPAVVRIALRRAMCNVSRDKLRQLARWSTTGEFASVDGTIDYRANLRRVETPTLVIGGALDRLAPPAVAEKAYDLLGTREKRVVILKESHGFSADYGHLDMIFGRRSRQEVFPLVAEWGEQILAAGNGKGEARSNSGGPARRSRVA